MRKKILLLTFLMGSITTIDLQINDSLKRGFSATYNYFIVNLFSMKYNASLCTNALTIEKFKNILKQLNIKEEILLFESRQTPTGLSCNTIACYDINFHAIILTPFFFKKSETVQDFTLYHELRHYLQQTTLEAQIDVQNIAQKYNISIDQAEEFDADITALEYIAQRNCSNCMQEIYDTHIYYTDKDHSQDGYITTKVVRLFLHKINEGKKQCKYHKNSL